MIAPAGRLVSLLCLSLATATVALPAVVLPTEAVAASPFSEAKYAAIVIDANSGEVLYAKNADSSRYPASITKIMTLYLTFEALSKGEMKLTDRVLVSPHAHAQAPSKLDLGPGESISVDEAIRAICIHSANDIAVAMAEKIGGTESRFAALMTQKAAALGMSNTRYVNASGLPDSRQLSSARDIAILSRAIMRDYPQYYAYFSQRSMTFHGREMRNHNGLMLRMPGVDGIKTGFTNASGFNLSASATRDGRRLIAVVMGGPSTSVRDNRVAELLNIGFDVMRRRSQGEQITVAQNMFEQPGSAPVTYASIGPKVDAGPKLDGAPVEPARPQLASAKLRGANLADARPARAEKAQSTRLKKKDPSATYLVQVGSFRQKSEARQWLTEVADRFEKHFAEAEGTVIATDGRYRTRFEGFTKDAAHAACQALKAKRLACMVMKD